MEPVVLLGLLAWSACCDLAVGSLRSSPYSAVCRLLMHLVDLGAESIPGVPASLKGVVTSPWSEPASPSLAQLATWLPSPRSSVVDIARSRSRSRSRLSATLALRLFRFSRSFSSASFLFSCSASAILFFLNLSLVRSFILTSLARFESRSNRSRS